MKINYLAGNFHEGIGRVETLGEKEGVGSIGNVLWNHQTDDHGWELCLILFEINE